MTTVFRLDIPQGGPRLPSDKRAELLTEIAQNAAKLIVIVEREKSGVCDGNGYWLGHDPVLSVAQRLIRLAEERVGT